MKSISEIALSYLGARQGGTKHLEILKIYNSNKPLPRGYAVKPTDNWCATFVSACAIKCHIGTSIYECGANRMLEKFKKQGWLVSPDKVAKNDIIFYDWQVTGNWYDHVGIIYEVTKNYVYVVEGNKSHKVGTRRIIKASLNNTKKYRIARIGE